jgi:hypothetical protein
MPCSTPAKIEVAPRAGPSQQRPPSCHGRLSMLGRKMPSGSSEPGSLEDMLNFETYAKIAADNISGVIIIFRDGHYSVCFQPKPSE